MDSVIPRWIVSVTAGTSILVPFTSFGCTTLVSDGQYRNTGTTSYTETLSWSHGNHTFKFGGDFRNVGEHGPNSFFSRRQVDRKQYGLFIWRRSRPGRSQRRPELGGGCPSLLRLRGRRSAGGVFQQGVELAWATDNKKFRQHEYDWFGQDTWKIRRNLTLTLGLRYQLDGVPYEENANFSNLFGDPTAGPVTLTVVGPGTGKQLYASDYSNLEPRVGFSWDPKRRWQDGGPRRIRYFP